MEIAELFGLVSNLGLGTFLVVIFIWGTGRYIIPGAVNRWDEFERVRTQRENTMHEYYRGVIRNLQEDSRLDKIKLLEAFQENTLTMSKTNDLLCILAKQLEDQGKDLDEIKKYIHSKEH